MSINHVTSSPPIAIGLPNLHPVQIFGTWESGNWRVVRFRRKKQMNTNVGSQCRSIDWWRHLSSAVPSSGQNYDWQERLLKKIANREELNEKRVPFILDRITLLLEVCLSFLQTGGSCKKCTPFFALLRGKCIHAIKIARRNILIFAIFERWCIVRNLSVPTWKDSFFTIFFQSITCVLSSGWGLTVSGKPNVSCFSCFVRCPHPSHELPKYFIN